MSKSPTDTWTVRDCDAALAIAYQRKIAAELSENYSTVQQLATHMDKLLEIRAAAKRMGRTG